MELPAAAAMPGLEPAVTRERFDAILDLAEGLVLGAYADPADAPAGRRRRVLILRDYGMAQRAEAPQFHPGPG